ncbi:hypothetical protein SISNIDRAFT_448828 [Sistotremastrum niveocremeum HHB9708]|uniref:Multiple myeloma tumor-associated protein 2-like N-terminal domain-containing protein n=2 Tax=Sistotremastraceae TaxID=3402574 RepID=A0A165A6X6_9AGAM|nr:hypothetical protein SISNIDRAFT_448828 [Sistotremastrum niveocremeum HHB9708]KZT43509.1 hypothetical protein SISSUDRAFT_1039936 [Sistotremastrum suecicum HHB10207 ss-3]
MYEPIRGGTRGGHAEFKWTDVSADKDRENYIGHSINAPTGRWQKNKDIHWYNRDIDRTEAERLEEIRRIKEAEEDALAMALGFKPTVRPNAQIPDQDSKADEPNPNPDEEEEKRRKAEKRERKERKRQEKEKRREAKAKHRSKSSRERHRSRTRSRSRSRHLSEVAHGQRRRSRSRTRSRSRDGHRRSESPPRERRREREAVYAREHYRRSRSPVRLPDERDRHPLESQSRNWGR